MKNQHPPRRPSGKATVIVFAIAVVTLGIGVVASGPIQHGVKNMLVLVGLGHKHADHAVEADGAKYYTCGMHPWVMLPKSGDCPVCRMKLVPMDRDKFTGQVAIDPLVVQNIGVRVAPVISGPLTRHIRTFGTVDYDETTVRDVNIKVPGWIEKLHVDHMGARVEQGDPLFDFYSPDLLETQDDYLRNLGNVIKLTADAAPNAEAKKWLEDTRTKLLYYDITPEQIEALEKRGKSSKAMTILSPHRGVVIAKHANEGMRVDQGMRVYRIADLSKLWVIVTLYEYQLPFIQRGQHAVMTLPYLPGQTFAGKVIYVYPYLDKTTRQVTVRLEVDNSNGLLKPGMFANVVMHNTLASHRTLAPREAIINTGERRVAFVSLDGGRFEPRRVTTGVESTGGMIEIIDGLRPGEMVVTSGQFLIDSEAKFREALAKILPVDPVADPAVDPGKLADLSPDLASGLSAILNDYFRIADRLADDSADGIDAPAQRIADATGALLQVTVPADPHFWQKHDEATTVQGKAIELADAHTLDQARLKFADLSVALNKLIRATGVPTDFGRSVQQLRCPMYHGGQGSTLWLQPAGDVRNPYFGPVMLQCFDQRVTLATTGGKTAAQPSRTTPKP